MPERSSIDSICLSKINVTEHYYFLSPFQAFDLSLKSSTEKRFFFPLRIGHRYLCTSKALVEKVLNKRYTEIADGKFFDVHKEAKVRFDEMSRLYLDSYSNYGTVKNKMKLSCR